jgi:hypothetical protein
MHNYLFVKRLLYFPLILFFSTTLLTESSKITSPAPSITTSLFPKTTYLPHSVNDIKLAQINSRPDTTPVFLLLMQDKQIPIQYNVPVNQKLTNNKACTILLEKINKKYASIKISIANNTPPTIFTLPIHVKNAQKDAAFNLLSKSALLPKNLYLAKYLPNNEEVKNDIARLYIDNKILLLHAKDLLIFKDNVWQKASNQTTKNFPLAYIKKISANQISILGWNVYGEKIATFAILSSLPTMEKKSLFSSLRQRGLNSISCFLEGQRIILKEGNILVKNKNCWHLCDHTLFQQHDLIANGPILVIDKIDKKNLKATLFDATLSCMESIDISIPASTHRGKRK